MYILYPVRLVFVPNELRHTVALVKFMAECLEPPNWLPLAGNIQNYVGDDSDAMLKCLMIELITYCNEYYVRRFPTCKIEDFILDYSLVPIIDGRCWGPGVIRSSQLVTPT